LGKGSRDGRSTCILPPQLRDADASGEDRLRRLLADVPVEFRMASPVLVIKTLPGSAHAVAAALDRTRWPEIVGSIAGDDTVFVATGDKSSLRRLRDRLIGLAGKH
jgi:transcriptional regulator of arginine metabolism